MLETYQVEASETFAREFKKLSKPVQEQIDRRIRWAASHREVLRPLRHLPKEFAGLQKLRAGDYRVLLWVDHAKRQLILYTVGHRSAIYQRL